MERALVVERRQHRSTVNAVAICFSLRLPASVKIGAYFFGGDDADRGRDQGVQGALKFSGWESGLRFEMRYLPERVDACVGAAGALDENFFLGDLRSCFGESALDRWQAGLDLPAVEGSAVVGDCEFDVAHGDESRLSHGGTNGM